MEFSDKKLNIFQRGILQKCIAFLAYLICASIAAFSIDLINKQWFISVAKKYYTNGQLPEEILKLFSYIMEFRVDTNIFNLALLISACVFVCFSFVRFIAQLNLSRPVTLDKVIEFRKAMENIEIFKPEERIDFIIKSKIPLYIAYEPIISTEKEHVKAQFYACSKYDYFISANTINKYTGMQLLCIEWNDYEYILKNYGQERKSAYLSKIADLESTIATLKGTFSLMQKDLDILTEEKARLETENKELGQKLQTLPGRQENTEKRERDRILFWRVAAPAVNALIAEATPGVQYSRPQIQAAFERELENAPELKADIQKLLHTSRKEAQNTPFALDGWAMELMRSALGELARKDPGATRKKEKS